MFSIDDLTDRYSVGMPIIRELILSEKWYKYFPWKETDWNNFGINDYYDMMNKAGIEGSIEVKRIPD
jgi:hypothetical protein